MLKDPGFPRRACLRQNLAFCHRATLVRLCHWWDLQLRRTRDSLSELGEGCRRKNTGHAGKGGISQHKYVLWDTWDILKVKVFIAYLNSRLTGCPVFLCDKSVILGRSSGRGKAELTYVPPNSLLGWSQPQTWTAPPCLAPPPPPRLRASSQRPTAASPSEPQPVLYPLQSLCPLPPPCSSGHRLPPAPLLPILA